MIRSLAGTLALLLLATPAEAYSVRVVGGEVVRWEQPDVGLLVQQAGSDDLTAQASLDAVRAALASWNDLACSTLAFEELGDAPDPGQSVPAGGSPNGHNEVVWIEDGWPHGKYTLGVTTPIAVMQAEITEADIAFNGDHHTWTTDGSGWTDLESVAVHELGHAFGLQHNLGPYGPDPPTMHPSVLPDTMSRSLEADDVGGACFLYPAEAHACAEPADCPRIVSTDASGDEYYAGAMACDEGAGTCAAPEWYSHGVAQLGEACQAEASCVEGLVCQPFQGEGVCSHYCLSGEPGECEEGFYCEPYDSHPQFGACLPEDGVIKPPGSGPLGCLSSSVCADGELCLPTPGEDVRRCTTVCVVDEEGGCPEGEGCWSYGNPNGACFPWELWPDTTPEEGPEPEPEPEPEPTPDAGPQPTAEAAPEGVPDALAQDGEPSDPGVEADDGGDDTSGCAGGPASGTWGLLAGLVALLARRYPGRGAPRKGA